MILKRQGYYKEMPHGDETDQSIFEYIHKKIDNKDKICNYLRNGYVLAACGNVVKEEKTAATPDDLVIAQIAALDLGRLTPLEAINLLYEYQEEIKKR